MTELESETPESVEAFELMMHLFEGRLDAAGVSRLDLALRQHISVRRLFVRVAHQYCALVPFIAARQQNDLSRPEDLDGTHQPARTWDSLNETMILPALNEMDAPGGGEEESGIFQPVPFDPAAWQIQSRAIGRRWYRVAMLMAFALLVAVAVVASRHGHGTNQQALHQDPSSAPVIIPQVIPPEPAIAMITATAGAKSTGAGSINPRTEMVAGRNLNLLSGGVEITFATGAKVIVRGPAQVRVVDRNSLAVDAGSVYAHVPTSAIGFRIVGPGLGVVDLGTNFGVRIVQGGTASEVHVFDGRINATALDDNGNSMSSSVLVEAGSAVTHLASSPDAPLKPVPFQAAAFDRDIDRIRVNVPSHGTGASLNAGSTDPQWQVVSIPNTPDWKAIPAAVVLDPRPEYVTNTAKAKWISLAPHMGYVAGGDYTYRTTIDLTGLDPGSVSVAASFAVDDNLKEIRVNGRPASIPNELALGLDGTLARTTLHQLSLSNIKWLNGPNQVDVVVWNLTGALNFTGIQLSWNISASPTVMR